MNGFSIGMSGLQVAQRAIEMIGNNIANAASEGYHRQDIKIAGVESSMTGVTAVGSGAEIVEIRRVVDHLLELERLRQQPAFGQVEQELKTLKTVEGSLGDIESNSLNTAINNFFNALRQVTADPQNQALQEQVLWAGEEMAGQFRSLDFSLTELQSHILAQAQTVTQQVNDLAHEIATCNTEIMSLAVRGGNAAILRDRRDQAILELSKLVDVRIETPDDLNGKVNVIAWGTPLVLGAQVTELQTDQMDDGRIGVSIRGAAYWNEDLQGGQLAGLLNLRNTLLPSLQDGLDTLASEIIRQINEVHVQGVGPDGSFTSMTGQAMRQGTIDTWSSPVSAGSFYIRLSDPAGVGTFHTVNVDPATDTLATIAGKLALLDPTHLTAEVSNSALHIETSGGYTFDFLPVPTLDSSGLTAASTATPTVTGIYSGSATDTFTATVLGGGEVGNSAGLSLEIRNSAGELVKTLDVGNGYVAGDKISLGYGLSLALSHGALADGETFDIITPANTDPTGFLAAAGMNSFFMGHSAATMAVRSALFENPNTLATSITPDGQSNDMARRLAAVAEQTTTALRGYSAGDFMRQLIAEVGTAVASRETRKAAAEQVIQQLNNQRDAISGVDINEEAAKLLVFERMYQGMARFVNVQDDVLDQLMRLID